MLSEGLSFAGFKTFQRRRCCQTAPENAHVDFRTRRDTGKMAEEAKRSGKYPLSVCCSWASSSSCRGESGRWTKTTAPGAAEAWPSTRLDVHARIPGVGPVMGFGWNC